MDKIIERSSEDETSQRQHHFKDEREESHQRPYCKKKKSFLEELFD